MPKTPSYKKQKTMKKINEEELRFVVRHYQTGRFDGRKAWFKFRQQHPACRRSLWQLTTKRHWAVAATIVSAVIAVMALGIYHYSHSISSPLPPVVPYNQQTDSVDKQSDSIRVFRYDNTPINIVLRDVSDYYGTTLTVNDTTRCVSGEIEATSLADVVDMLETTLGVKIQN